MTKFQIAVSPSQDIKQNVLLVFILIYLQSSSKPTADREKKAKDGNTKTWTSQEQNELFRWNKKHFS